MQKRGVLFLVVIVLVLTMVPVVNASFVHWCTPQSFGVGGFNPANQQPSQACLTTVQNWAASHLSGSCIQAINRFQGLGVADSSFPAGNPSGLINSGACTCTDIENLVNFQHDGVFSPNLQNSLQGFEILPDSFALVCKDHLLLENSMSQNSCSQLAQLTFSSNREIANQAQNVANELECNSQLHSAYALGVIGDDDDDPCDGTSQFGILPQIDESFLAVRDLIPQSSRQCEWKNLPTQIEQTPGCYYFATEDDRNEAGKKHNDCVGFYAPFATQITNELYTSSAAALFQDDAQKALEYSFYSHFIIPNQFEGITQGISGQHDTERKWYDISQKDEAVMCVFAGHELKNSGPQYICGVENNEYKWFSCSELSLSTRTGLFVPYRYKQGDQCDVNALEELSVCARDNKICANGFCVDSIQDAPVQSVSKEQATHGMFCVEKVGPSGVTEYGWENREVTCDDLPDSDVCENNKAVCLAGDENAWLEGAQGGNACCGNSEDDLGSVERGADGKNYICVGTDGNANTKTNGDVIRNAPGDLEGTQWRWLAATDVDSQEQRIITLHSQEGTFDVVTDTVNWHYCRSENNTNQILDPPAGLQPQDFNFAKSLYCYKEGDHYSFVSCLTHTGNEEPEHSEPAIFKQRIRGDALYSLPVFENVISTRIPLTVENTNYRTYYGDDALFNFEGYDQIEMSLSFYDKDGQTQLTEQDLIDNPPIVKMLLLGPHGPNGQESIYLEKNILGNIVSRPAFVQEKVEPQEGEGGSDNDPSRSFIKTTIPANLPGIYGIVIVSENENIALKIHNIFLTKLNEPTLYCSGEQSQESNWIDNHDNGGTSRVNGKNMCTRHFGNDAWFGNDNEIDSQYNYANCCGNNVDGTEYYAGPGLGEANACWNSMVLKDGQSAGEVQVEVSSHRIERDIQISTRGNPVILRYSALGSDLIGAQNPQSDDQIRETLRLIKDKGEQITEQRASVEQDEYFPSKRLSTSNIELETVQEIVLYEFSFDNARIPSVNIKEEITVGEITINGNSYNPKIFLRNTQTGEVLGKSVNLNQLSRNQITLQVVLEPTLPILDFRVGEPQRLPNERAIISTPCKSSTCIIPIPGEPTYTISNPKEGEYDLYFKNSTHKVLIQDQQTFNSYGILIAENVPQIVVYTNGEVTQEDLEEIDEDQEAEQEIGELNPAFYSCNTNVPLNAIPFTQGAQYCMAVGDLYCSPQSFDYSKRTTIAGSWTDLGLHHAILPEDYEGIEVDTPAQFLEVLEPSEITPEQEADLAIRNQTAVALPTRNLVANALFDIHHQKLPYWTLLSNGATVNENSLRNYVGEKIVTLQAGDTLRSDKIIIPELNQGHTLLFTDESECQVTLTTTDTQGNTNQVPENQEFATINLRHLTIEYEGACEVRKPYLQIVDGLGALETLQEDHYNDPTDTSHAYAPVACCPTNYCWDGHSCVAPMNDATHIAAYVEEGRTYRCIDGQWSALPILWDWDKEKWGFCSMPEQCLVATGGDVDPDSSAQTFTQGQIPGCIDNGEYIMDNYCNAGQWSSRTSFVANALLDIAEDEEYTLQCGSVYEMLPQLDDQVKRYLYGTGTAQAQGAVAIGQEQQEIEGVCFTDLIDLGRDDDVDNPFITNPKNTCVNNICVLKLHRDDGDVTIMGTSLNKNLSDANFFATALGDLESDLASAACQSDEQGFVECDLPGRSDVLLYENNISAIIYAQEDFEGNVLSRALDAVIEFFASLFGDESELDANPRFLQDASRFDQVYLMYKDDTQVRGVLEQSSGNKSAVMIVEYQGFDTNICDYLDTEHWEGEAGCGTLVNAAQPETSCINEGELQRYQATCGFDMWSQITGRLRVSEQQE